MATVFQQPPTTPRSASTTGRYTTSFSPSSPVSPRIATLIKRALSPYNSPGHRTPLWSSPNLSHSKSVRHLTTVKPHGLFQSKSAHNLKTSHPISLSPAVPPHPHRPLSLPLSSPFHPRPIGRRGHPYSEELPNTLYDGYSSSHGDGIIDFCAPLESQPPDILAYFILVDRLRDAHYRITKEELFQMPLRMKEAASGAAFLEEQRVLGQGVFVDRNAWITQAPVDPTHIPIWTYTLAQVRELNEEKVSRGDKPISFGHIHVGPQWKDMMFTTNIRAMYPSYIVPIDWKTLLKMTFQLYRPMFHPIHVWVLERSTEPFEIEAYVYDAVYCIGNLIIDDLVPEDVQREMMVWPDHGTDDESCSECDASWSSEECDG